MKNLRQVFSGMMVFGAGIFMLASCNVDPDPVPFDAALDVVVQDMKTDTEVQYAIVIYASANDEIKSVKVTGPGTEGIVYDLTATESTLQFAYIPEPADYTSEFPVTGDYTFEIISKTDEKITGKDAVGNQQLAPIVIKTTTMTNHLLKTTWDKITGADAYVIRLYSDDKEELLFNSSVMTDKAEYEFGASTSGWTYGKSPVAGTEYVVELLGIRIEAGVTVDKLNHLQFITLDSKTIEWE
jgi:hypothetical protein